MKEPTYINVPYEIEQKALGEVKEKTKDFFKLIQDHVNQLVWQVVDEYMNEHMEGDAISNLQSSIRQEVCRCSHIWCRDKEDFYGKSIREQLWNEYKEELAPMIQCERIEELEKELARTVKNLEFERKLNRPGY